MIRKVQSSPVPRPSGCWPLTDFDLHPPCPGLVGLAWLGEGALPPFEQGSTEPAWGGETASWQAKGGSARKMGRHEPEPTRRSNNPGLRCPEWCQWGRFGSGAHVHSRHGLHQPGLTTLEFQLS